MAVPEPRFDRVDEAEREGSARLFRIIGLLVGPSLVLGAFGLYELAVKVFLIAAGIGASIVYAYHKTDRFL